MASPNGARPGQTRPPQVKKQSEVRCWVTMIVEGYGELTPVWVPCKMPVGAPPQELS